MKNFSLFLFALLISLSSCKKDDEKIADGVNAEVSGQTWTASNTEARDNDDALVIETKTADGQTIIIKTNGTAEGTYNLSDNGNFCTYSTASGAFFAVHPQSNKPCGKVVITHYDKDKHKINGHFEFNAYDHNQQLISCTNGHFGNIDIQQTHHNPHPKCGLFVTTVDNGYCGSANISCNTSGDHLAITGNCGTNGQSVSFKVPTNCTTGDYQIGPWGGGSVSCNYNTGGNWGFGSINANCGTFTVTKHDQENQVIEGHFNMTLFSFNPLGGGNGANFQHGSFTTSY